MAGFEEFATVSFSKLDAVEVVMWFPVDNGMINLERVAFIEVEDGYEISFYNDHRAELSRASFETQDQLRQYLERLKEELNYPLGEAEAERFPQSEKEPLLESGAGTDADGGPGR